MRNSTGAAWAETRDVTPGTSSSDAARIGKSEYLMLKYEVTVGQRTRFTSPACGGGRREAPGGGSLNSKIPTRGGTPIPALPRKSGRVGAAALWRHLDPISSDDNSGDCTTISQNSASTLLAREEGLEGGD